MELLESFFQTTSDFLWGPPLILLVVAGGLFFLIYSHHDSDSPTGTQGHGGWSGLPGPPWQRALITDELVGN